MIQSSLTPSTITIIVLYHSRHGTTQQLARHIARGIESVEHCQASLRTVADINPDDAHPTADQSSK